MVRPLRSTYVAPWLITAAYWDDETDPQLSSAEIYQRWIRSRIDFFLQRALDASDPKTGRTTTPEDVAWINATIDEYSPALLEPFQPCFVMNDFKEGNTIAAKIDGHWRITGVVDLMEGYFGDGEADLSRILSEYKIGEPSAEECVHAFLEAYFRTCGEQSVRPGFMKRYAIYLIMDQMILWAGGRQLGWFDDFADFRTNCERYLCVRMETLPAVLCT